ncbi:hypothetical protein ACSTS3_14110 [Aquimarina muelleri]|uniref:hypothetical protein n=1 Tax=Aquimarina muelleri TaxID=279356 RepID=UPI003F686966
MSKYQGHFISNHPEPLMKEDVLPNKGVIVDKADHSFYIEDASGSGAYIFLGVVFSIISLWILYPFNPPYNTLTALVVSFLLISLFMIFYGIFANKEYKKVILDRMNGTITYPDSFFRKPLKGKFKDLKVIISISGGDGYSTKEYLKFVNTFSPRLVDSLKTVSYDDPYQHWSFMVWYMDKNRPLPPGTAFDEYRQQDFERRKALGFPRPLYPSDIPTPEATPEQQRERKLIGGW